MEKLEEIKKEIAQLINEQKTDYQINGIVNELEEFMNYQRELANTNLDKLKEAEFRDYLFKKSFLFIDKNFNNKKKTIKVLFDDILEEINKVGLKYNHYPFVEHNTHISYEDSYVVKAICEYTNTKFVNKGNKFMVFERLD